MTSCLKQSLKVDKVKKIVRYNKNRYNRFWINPLVQHLEHFLLSLVHTRSSGSLGVFQGSFRKTQQTKRTRTLKADFHSVEFSGRTEFYTIKCLSCLTFYLNL